MDQRTTPRGLRRALAITTSGALAALGLSVGLAAPAIAADGIIVNPGFESGLADWTVTGDAAGSKIESGGITGDRLTHYLDAGGSVTTAQTVTGLTEGWWTFTASVKSGAPIDSSRLVASGCGVDGETVVPGTSVDDRWLTLSVSAYVSDGSCTVGLVTTGGAGAWASIDDVSLRSGTVDRVIRGADLSTLAKNQDFGATYADAGGVAVDPVEAFADAGANLGRLKVWVDPADGYNDTDEVVATAQRIKAAGMGLLVDFHYSDRWTDPGAQAPPAAWLGMTVPEMADAVYDHTTEVLTALADAGITADAVQVGNETNPGMLLPFGQSYDVDPSDAVVGPQWDSLALFLTAGSRAVKDVNADTDVLLHLTEIDNGVEWWFDEMVARDVPFDVIGLSYYSYWHGTLWDVQNAVTTLSAKYEKDVLIVENAYAFTMEDDLDAPLENIIRPTSVDVSLDYPVTPQGQASKFRAVQDIVASAPGGRGLGVVYWEPAWTAATGSGWDPSDPASGNAWENQAMFDFDGRALPALAEYAPDATASPLIAATAPTVGLGRIAVGATGTADLSVTNTGAVTFTGTVSTTTSAPFTVSDATGGEAITIAPGESRVVGAVQLADAATTGDVAGTVVITVADGIRPAALDPAATRTTGFSGSITVPVAASVTAAAAPGGGTGGVDGGVGAGAAAGSGGTSADGVSPVRSSASDLAETGADTGWWFAAAAALLIAGAALVTGARLRARRR